MADNVYKMIENGSSSSAPLRWKGGSGVFKCFGTFNGATVSLQYKGPDGSTMKDVGPYTTLTANGEGGFIMDECELQVVVSGGTPSGLYATIGEL